MPVQQMSLSTVVDLVNGWGTVPRAEAGEAGTAYPALAQLLRHTDLTARARRLTDADLKRVADLLHPVFAATSAAERAALVNAVLTRAGVRPDLHVTPAGRIEPGWLVEDPHDALLAAAATALGAQLVEQEPDRLGTCAGDRCADAYIDASPGAHRRFCSITCQNRARVAAFRRRRAASA